MKSAPANFLGRYRAFSPYTARILVRTTNFTTGNAGVSKTGQEIQNFKGRIVARSNRSFLWRLSENRQPTASFCKPSGHSAWKIRRLAPMLPGSLMQLRFTVLRSRRCTIDWCVGSFTPAGNSALTQEPEERKHAAIIVILRLMSHV